MDLFWIGLSIVLAVLSIVLIAVCDPSPGEQ